MQALAQNADRSRQSEKQASLFSTLPSPLIAILQMPLHFGVEDFELLARAVTLRPLRNLFQAARDI
jgi:hypothetical protein